MYIYIYVHTHTHTHTHRYAQKREKIAAFMNACQAHILTLTHMYVCMLFAVARTGKTHAFFFFNAFARTGQTHATLAA